MDYDEYLTYLKKARASLNVARDDQDCVTLRELECVFDGIKCITTNKNIVNFELYDKSRFFVLDGNNYKELTTFMDLPFKPISKEELNNYRFIKSVEDNYLNK